MITLDISSYIKSNWAQYLDTISTLSRSSLDKAPLITSNTLMYNFDKITEDLFEGKDNPQSVDAVCVTEKSIDLIEFKTGFKSKITKENFDPNKATCEFRSDICPDYWRLFKELRQKEKQIILTSIKEKAIESFVTLEKKVLSNCEISEKKIKLNFIAVVDVNAEEAIEDIYGGLAGEAPKDNQIDTIRQSLIRLKQYEDNNGKRFYFDEVTVLSSEDFTNTLASKNNS